MSEEIERTKATFESGGVELVCYLHLPADAAGALPCVVVGHGFSGTQDRLFYIAERFARDGLAALTFDYRNFGESGGEPRQVIDIEGQRADWRSAVSWARSRPEIDPDRVALWGSSLGGTHTIFVASEDPRVAAVVAASGWTSSLVLERRSSCRHSSGSTASRGCWSSPTVATAR